ncbi:replication-relaxation family protein, partial [Paenibacillus sp. MCAF20]
MIERDKAIIADLERFRCLTRDDVAELHFSGLKNPIKETNLALLRLRKDGRIGVSKERRMYVYFPVPGIKKDSSKLGHFLTIAGFYREIRRIEAPRVFEVEPKLGGKGLPEPDAFVIWRGAPWYVEIQRSVYSEKQWTEKMNRYEKYYLGGEWERAEWQPVNKKIFPYVWIVGSCRYKIGATSFRVVQDSVDKLI